MSDRRKRVRFICPDPRYDFAQIDFGKDDLIVPVPGVFLGDCRRIITEISFIPGINKSLVVFTPHNPCAAVPNATDAYNLGCGYADCLHSYQIRAISLFLGQEAVELYDPMQAVDDIKVQDLFIEASYWQRRDYGKNTNPQITEVAVKPFFSTSDLRKGVLHISSHFFDFIGVNALKEAVGGKLPHRNYDPKISRNTKILFEDAFAA